ncbi:hypothetical protein AVEN_271634-1 [Araneus ventricosus]|uniref:Uncharacterized protein n=1 Tax=Araneus ventricosus TaxID=182803 RepID=A0A4Y2RPV0_ARAVE|nr:hypothetical protein AVEN_271634-1 [Araneus ventricosus]
MEVLFKTEQITFAKSYMLQKVLDISTRSSYMGFSVVPHGISNVLENLGMCRISPAATEMQVNASSTETIGVLNTMSSFDSSRRSPGMLGPVMLQATEPNHHDVSILFRM